MTRVEMYIINDYDRQNTYVLRHTSGGRAQHLLTDWQDRTTNPSLHKTTMCQQVEASADCTSPRLPGSVRVVADRPVTRYG